MLGAARLFASRLFAPRLWPKLGAFAPSALTITVEAYLVGAWVNVSSDVHAETGIRIKYGIDGNGPLDCFADPGECSLALVNEANALTGRLQGAFSPIHANAIAGWTYGVPLRVTFTDPDTGAPSIKHRGKVRVIDPMAGKKLERLVHVVSYDVALDLDETDVRALGIQTDKTEMELMALVLDALPADSQPVARVFDAGVDVFAYAFYDLGDGVKATELINDIATDAFAFVVVRGDGTFVARNRSTRTANTLVSQGTFTDATLRGFSAPSSLDQVFNLVRVTIHPPTIDPATTTVLYADTTVRAISAGQTVEFWASYSDEMGALIGGLDVQPLDDGVDYAGNAQVDGLGADLTANVVPTLTAFGSTALVSITNTHGSATVYLVDGSGDPWFQIRGRGVYDFGPQTYEDSSTETYGTRPLSVDLRYQDDPQVAQTYAEFLVAQRHSLANQPQALVFVANSAALLTQALVREPGDTITVSETMTGFAEVPAVIHSVELTVMAGDIITCRWGLAPVSPIDSWLLEVPGRSELGVSTILGF